MRFIAIFYPKHSRRWSFFKYRTPSSLISGIRPAVAPDTTSIPPYGLTKVGSVGRAEQVVQHMNFGYP
ncbi:MAG: hypothetical protein CM15mP10_1760 [Actinomycetota bacterium]|nr:MAG: hypothetical protein CM15mP10_1760 [Actinomycetota bacterium]